MIVLKMASGITALLTEDQEAAMDGLTMMHPGLNITQPDMCLAAAARYVAKPISWQMPNPDGNIACAAAARAVLEANPQSREAAIIALRRERADLMARNWVTIVESPTSWVFCTFINLLCLARGWAPIGYHEMDGPHETEWASYARAFHDAQRNAVRDIIDRHHDEYTQAMDHYLQRNFFDQDTANQIP